MTNVVWTWYDGPRKHYVTLDRVRELRAAERLRGAVLLTESVWHYRGNRAWRLADGGFLRAQAQNMAGSPGAPGF